MAGPDNGQGSNTPGMTLLVIKNPTRSDGFPLEVSLDASVREVQGLIARNYPGNPDIEEQTVSNWDAHILTLVRQAPAACCQSAG
jgi:hypothetical protein